MAHRSLLPQAVDDYLRTVVAHETPLQQRLRAGRRRACPWPGCRSARIRASCRVPGSAHRRADHRRQERDRGRDVHRLQRARGRGALPVDGRLVCCDVSEEWTAIARRYWAEAGVADKIELHLRPAQRDAGGTAAEERRRRVRFRVHRCRQDRLRHVLRGLPHAAAPGGLIAIDNVLWSGTVADPSDQRPDTVACGPSRPRSATIPASTPASSASATACCLRASYSEQPMR